MIYIVSKADEPIFEAAGKISRGETVLNSDLASVRRRASMTRDGDPVAQACQDAFETHAAKNAGYTRKP